MASKGAIELAKSTFRNQLCPNGGLRTKCPSGTNCLHYHYDDNIQTTATTSPKRVSKATPKMEEYKASSNVKSKDENCPSAPPLQPNNDITDISLPCDSDAGSKTRNLLPKQISAHAKIPTTIR